jgi:tetratricopeptide (TPR) repeat protein
VRSRLCAIFAFCALATGTAFLLNGAAVSLLSEAVEALKHGDNLTAETKLRAEVAARPSEPEAWSFLGVSLDNQKKFSEAEAAHRKALALAPHSNSVLDRFGAHQLTMGDAAGARKTFNEALAVIPSDGFANLQLATMALREKNGAEALTYLNRLSPQQRNAPDVIIDRVMALELSGDHARALAAEAALEKTGSADALYSLAYAWETLGRPVETLRVLARAAGLAPNRPDIQKSFASSAANLGQYGPALAAWDHYVKLAPTDAAARRERGFAAIHVNQREAGIAELRWYTGRHPEDPDGWYELAIGENSLDPTSGMPDFDRAIQLKPDFAAALSSRGALRYRDGKAEDALPDLERAVKIDPANAIAQYRLGQVYQALDRLQDALVHYRRAAQLAPDDYQAQFHLANALAEAGQTAESDVLLERIRNWPTHTSAPNPDLVDTR